jgi:colicin import membrane protein
MQNEIVTFEQAMTLTGKKALDFFSSEENVRPLITQVKTEALSLVPNLNTQKGRDEIGSTALKVSKSRKLLEDAINASVADLKSKVKTATDIKKTVVEELNQVREQVLAPRIEWQKEQDRLEKIRVNEIKDRINNIRELANYGESDSKERIGELIEALDLIDVSTGFSEFTEEAAKAISDGIKALNSRIIVLIEKEQADEQRTQLEAEQKKNRIQERLSALVQIPLSLMGKSSGEIQRKIDSLNKCEISDDEFDDRTEEAKSSLNQVISQLSLMLNQATQLESIRIKTNKSYEVEKVADATASGTNDMFEGKRVPLEDVFQSRLQQAKAIVNEVQSSPVTELKPKQVETVTISVDEYKYLLHRSEKLDALEAAGVDNWNGYSEAMEMLKAS